MVERFPAKSKRKSDTGRHHSPAKPHMPLGAARVALQRCPILHMSKSKIMVPIIVICVKGLDWPSTPSRWPYFTVTVASKVRATGLFSLVFVYKSVAKDSN